MRLIALLPLIMLSGCIFDLESDGPEVGLSLHSDVPLRPGLEFIVTTAGRTHTLPLGTTPGDYRTTVKLHSDGNHNMQAGIQEIVGDPLIANVSFEHRFEEDHDHWVSGWIGLNRPVGHCIGTLVATPIEPRLDPARPDSLFVMYGSIPKGAVC